MIRIKIWCPHFSAYWMCAKMQYFPERWRSKSFLINLLVTGCILVQTCMGLCWGERFSFHALSLEERPITFASVWVFKGRLKGKTTIFWPWPWLWILNEKKNHNNEKNKKILILVSKKSTIKCSNLKFSNIFLIKFRDLGKQMALSAHVKGLSDKSNKALNWVGGGEGLFP